MKIIFSRKGFDKSNGGVASPIFPGGGLRSLPIPNEWDQKHPPAPRYRVSYNELRYKTEDVGSLVEDLTVDHRKKKPRIKSENLCLFSPDLIRHDRVRRFGWLPLLAQKGTALAHLFNHGVSEGDLFLFFGWFRRIQEADGHFRFDATNPGVHLIFGWLQIGQIWYWYAPDHLPKWAKHHPVVQGEVGEFNYLSKPQSGLFIAKRRLELPGIRRPLPGGGIFQTFHSDLCLSGQNNGRRVWQLPGWMYPFPNRMPLTYHPHKTVWKKSGKWALLQTVGRGQEFILDLDSPECSEKYSSDKAEKWLVQIFSHAR